MTAGPSSTAGPSPTSGNTARFSLAGIASGLGILLSARDLRIDVEGRPEIDGPSFETKGRHVLVLGAPRILFAATLGLAPVARGRLDVGGVSAAEAARSRVVAGAPLDPALPPKWTVREYIVWSARLAGASRIEAEAGTDRALAKLALGTYASTRLAQATAQVRRATVIAGAVATGASIIALEDPFFGLPDDVGRSFAETLVGALEDVAWIVFSPRVPLTSPFATSAHHAVVLSGSTVEAEGTPAQIAGRPRRYVLRALGPVEALAQQLSSRGGSLEINGGHVTVELGPLGVPDLVRLCDGLEIAVIELVPIARALL